MLSSHELTQHFTVLHKIRTVSPDEALASPSHEFIKCCLGKSSKSALSNITLTKKFDINLWIS